MAKKVRVKGKGAGGFPEIKKALRVNPITVAREVAATATPAITSDAKASYKSARTAYGTPRRPWRGDKNVPDLYCTGRAFREMHFRSYGREIWCVLGMSKEALKYTKYLIGKYSVLPNGNASIPIPWQRLFRSLTDREMAKHNARPL